MDTRSKIVEAAKCRDLGLTVAVTGYFDPLLAWHARELDRIRGDAPRLIAIVLPLANELLPQRARAALVAALRVVDYVLIAKNEELEMLFALLAPAEIVRLDAADLRRRDQLMEKIRCRQTC